MLKRFFSKAVAFHDRLLTKALFDWRAQFWFFVILVFLWAVGDSIDQHTPKNNYPRYPATRVEGVVCVHLSDSQKIVINRECNFAAYRTSYKWEEYPVWKSDFALGVKMFVIGKVDPDRMTEIGFFEQDTLIYYPWGNIAAYSAHK